MSNNKKCVASFLVNRCTFVCFIPNLLLYRGCFFIFSNGYPRGARRQRVQESLQRARTAFPQLGGLKNPRRPAAALPAPIPAAPRRLRLRGQLRLPPFVKGGLPGQPMQGRMALPRIKAPAAPAHPRCPARGKRSPAAGARPGKSKVRAGQAPSRKRSHAVCTMAI